MCKQKLSDLNAILKEPSSQEVRNQNKLNFSPLVAKRSSQIDPDYILKIQESHSRECLFEKKLRFAQNQYSSIWRNMLIYQIWYLLSINIHPLYFTEDLKGLQVYHNPWGDFWSTLTQIFIYMPQFIICSESDLGLL